MRSYSKSSTYESLLALVAFEPLPGERYALEVEENVAYTGVGNASKDWRERDLGLFFPGIPDFRPLAYRFEVVSPGLFGRVGVGGQEAWAARQGGARQTPDVAVAVEQLN